MLKMVKDMKNDVLGIQPYLEIVDMCKDLNFLQLLADEDLSRPLYDLFFNAIYDPENSRTNFKFHLITYINVKHLAIFAYLGALAKKRPVLSGKWERMVYDIAAVSKYFNDPEEEQELNIPDQECCIPGHVLTKCHTTLEWLLEVSTPQLCPNPCLRLELIRLLSHFSSFFTDFDYDRESFRELIVDTICEINHKYTTLTTRKIHKFSFPKTNQIFMSVIDIKKLIDINLLDIQSVMNRNPSTFKRNKIISAFVKISGLLAPREPREGILCLSFCGFIPRNTEFNLTMNYFINMVSDVPFLLDYVIDTFKAIDDASHILGDPYDLNGKPCNSVIELRDVLLHKFFKHYVSMFPKHQSLWQVHGGANSKVVEYRVNYFYNSARFAIDE